MSLLNFGTPSGSRRLAAIALAALVAAATLSTPARAQDVVTKETAAAVKASFLMDLDGLQGKFLQLAQAIPPDKYTWRPMEGVRSVSEVFMLIAIEGHTLIPTAFGGKATSLGTQDEMGKLRVLSDKAQVIEWMTKGFANAKKEIEAVDPATLTAKRRVMGREGSVLEGAMAVAGDLHEHLGQLIAYARSNRVVPPWSK